MYERSAIVLERNIEEILELNNKYNLRKNFDNYIDLIEEIENYQIMTERQNKIIQEFDDAVAEIERIQQKEDKLSNDNIRLEENRKKCFFDLGEDSEVLEKKLLKIENTINKNNDELKILREEFCQVLSDFTKKQKERNKSEKDRRVGEAKHLEYTKNAIKDFNEIDVKSLLVLKEFIESDKEKIINEILDLMIKNGKNEKVGFNKDVIKLAIKTRVSIAEKEAESYITIYAKTKKLLSEIDNEALALDKYKKTLKENEIKLNFLNAYKDYIVGFLDYERMTAISGTKMHNKMMEEACNNFELDNMQINNLYELIIKEISNKGTKKAYKDLYNKTYLKNIQEKERNFEEEVNNINIKMGTVINSNYWRIEGIKNIYNVFQEEVSSKYNKDIEELQIEESKLDDYEEIDEIEEIPPKNTDKKIEKDEKIKKKEKDVIEKDKKEEPKKELEKKDIVTNKKIEEDDEDDDEDDFFDDFDEEFLDDEEDEEINYKEEKENLDDDKNHYIIQDDEEEENYFENIDDNVFDDEDDDEDEETRYKRKFNEYFKDDEEYIDIYKYNPYYTKMNKNKKNNTKKKEDKQQNSFLDILFKDRKTKTKEKKKEIEKKSAKSRNNNVKKKTANNKNKSKKR